MSRIYNFSKGLRRDLASTVDPGLPEEAAFLRYVNVLADVYAGNTGAITPYDSIEQLASSIGAHAGDPDNSLRWTNPLGGLSFDLEGLVPSSGFMSNPPEFRSETTAAEMAELYWMALLRDAPKLSALMRSAPASGFQEALDDLNKYPYYKSLGSPLTIERLFRIDLRDPQHPDRWGFEGVQVGPYVSQFLLRGNLSDAGKKSGEPSVLAFGSLRLQLKEIMAAPGQNFLVSPEKVDPSGADYLAVQNGSSKAIGKDNIKQGLADLRYLTSLRDGATYAHFDRIYQEYLIASVLLLDNTPPLGATLAPATPAAVTRTDDQAAPVASPQDPAQGTLASNVSEEGAQIGGQGARDSLLNFGNPYYQSQAQVGFATFGVTQIVTMLAEIATRAHKAGWYQKWLHLRLRPEEYAARIHFSKTSNAADNKYGIPNDLWNSALLDRIASDNQKQSSKPAKSYLLPMAYAEGCPTHPAYPSGHATVGGACVTVLKALFNETLPLNLDGNFIPEDTGLTLRPYVGELTVGGELNKLASNIAMFRSFSGVHWKSDGVQGILLGEQVAIAFLMQSTQSFTDEQGQRISLSAESRGNAADPHRVPFYRFSMFSGKRIEIREGRLFTFDNTAYGTGVPAQQKSWGDANTEISLEDLIANHQGIPAY